MPRCLICGLLMLSVWLAFGAGVESQAPSRKSMSPVDLLNIPRVGDPQISPDGTRVLFLLATTDWAGNRRVPQIWQIGVNGTNLRRLTSGDNGAAAARWSPDGSSIAFLSRGSINVMDADGAGARQVSKRTGVSEIAWHPDGRSIFFLAAEPPTDAERERQRVRGDIRVLDEAPRRHLWKVSVADGEESRITSGGDHTFGFKISPRGDRIIVHRRPTALPADTDRMELWNIAVDGSAPIQITRNAVPEYDGELSPDGTQVLFIARANDRFESYYNANVFLAPASGGQARPLLPDYPHEILQAGWAEDSKSIWMVANLGARSQLLQVVVSSREIRQITTGDHSVVPLTWTSAAGRHVFQIDEPARIGDIWTWAPGDAGAVRVTSIYDYLDRRFQLPRQALVQWKGSDGTPIEGILTYPIDYTPGTRYPLVVQLHGGPEASDRFGWGSIFFYYQPAWAGRGYAILRPNYRGSSGYGNRSYREPVGGYFKNSHLDVLAGVDRLIVMGIADGDRVGIMGWSAGGHLVNKLITFTNRFKAAASGAGVANWISLYGSSDTRSDRDLWLGGTLWQPHPPIETYWEQSPLRHVSKVRTPTLFLSGENDTRVPVSQAIEFSRALKALGVPTELHIAPNEGHDWAQPRHQLHKMNAELEWFERYVRTTRYTPQVPPSENDGTVLPTP